jgi:hypothetical protein
MLGIPAGHSGWSHFFLDQGFLIAGFDDVAYHFLPDVAAKLLLDHLQRHLAGAEPV